METLVSDVRDMRAVPLNRVDPDRAAVSLRLVLPVVAQKRVAVCTFGSSI